jgi:transposase
MTLSPSQYYIGVDVSKATLDVFILPTNQPFSFQNNPAGIHALLKHCAQLLTPCVVLEATGGYEQPLAHSLMNAGIAVAIVNPRRVRDFAKAYGKLAKTDKIDAHVLAAFGQTFQPRPQMSVDDRQQALAEVSTRRRQLIDMITQEKNRLALAGKHTKKSIQTIIKALEKELKTIDSAQAKTIAQDPQLTAKSERLQTIKGVGTVVATSLVADLPELGQLSNKQITALVGLAPYNCDSGTFKGKRTIWGGRASVRSICYMATLVAIRHNVQIKAFYLRLCTAGKQKKVAIIACMRKLIVIMNAMIKNQQPWKFVAT